MLVYECVQKNGLRSVTIGIPEGLNVEISKISIFTICSTYNKVQIRDEEVKPNIIIKVGKVKCCKNDMCRGSLEGSDYSLDIELDKTDIDEDGDLSEENKSKLRGLGFNEFEIDQLGQDTYACEHYNNGAKMKCGVVVDSRPGYEDKCCLSCYCVQKNAGANYSSGGDRTTICEDSWTFIPRTGYK